jgi:hypothetical protein
MPAVSPSTLEHEAKSEQGVANDPHHNFVNEPQVGELVCHEWMHKSTWRKPYLCIAVLAAGGHLVKFLTENSAAETEKSDRPVRVEKVTR